tara:strand:- start:19775 stop:20113 length:339 start_codon:yes stop_codon:yes gene_type:complete
MLPPLFKEEEVGSFHSTNTAWAASLDPMLFYQLRLHDTLCDRRYDQPKAPTKLPALAGRLTRRVSPFGIALFSLMTFDAINANFPNTIRIVVELVDIEDAFTLLASCIANDG